MAFKKKKFPIPPPFHSWRCGSQAVKGVTNEADDAVNDSIVDHSAEKKQISVSQKDVEMLCSSAQYKETWKHSLSKASNTTDVNELIKTAFHTAATKASAP